MSPKSEAWDPTACLLAAVNGATQGLYFFAEIVGQVYAAAGDIADSVAGFAHVLFGSVGPIAKSIFGIVETALQIAAHLLAGFGSEQKACQGPSAQSNQEEGNGRAHAAAV
jgi:hypothetical protein